MADHPDTKITDIKQAYDEFERGLRAIRAELQALVNRTIGQIDEAQAQKISAAIHEKKFYD